MPPLEAYDADILTVLLPPPDPERAEDDVPRWAAEPTWTYVPVGARLLVQPNPRTDPPMCGGTPPASK